MLGAGPNVQLGAKYLHNHHDHCFQESFIKSLSQFDHFNIEFFFNFISHAENTCALAHLLRPAIFSPYAQLTSHAPPARSMKCKSNFAILNITPMQIQHSS